MDVHSFPADTDAFGTPDTDVVLLDNYGLSRSFAAPTLALAKHLAQRGITCRILKGGENSINVEAIHNGLETVFLVELNEALSSRPSRYAQVIEALADFLRPLGLRSDTSGCGTDAPQVLLDHLTRNARGRISLCGHEFEWDATHIGIVCHGPYQTSERVQSALTKLAGLLVRQRRRHQ